MMKVGIHKQIITPFIKNATLFGYGKPSQKAKYVQSELHARTVIFQNDEEKIFIYTNCELGAVTNFLTDSIYQELIKLESFKNLSKSEFMLSAQHTHSAPGGLFKYPLYNLPSGGHRSDVFNFVKEKILFNIIEAYKDIQNAKLYWKKDRFNEATPVAFNRSLNAFLSNPEVINHKSYNTKNSIDRKMRLLHIIRDNDEAIINWFGVHSTSMPNSNKGISSDNKGYASTLMEEQNFKLAIFAQEKCGDVSPNFKNNFWKREHQGPYNTAIENMQFNGKLQFEKANEITKLEGIKLSDSIKTISSFKKLSEIKIHDQFLINNDDKVNVATKGSMGFAFIKGTTDGQGLHPIFINILKPISKIIYSLQNIYLKANSKLEYDIQTAQFALQGNKEIFLQSGSKKILGFKNPLMLLPISIFDFSIKTFFKKFFSGELEEFDAWIDENIPMQLTLIGELAILGIPFEITTIAGRRLILSTDQILKEKGIKNYAINTYSNSYAGYITTPQEYECQNYEGGHTLFGKMSLPALQSEFINLAKQI